MFVKHEIKQYKVSGLRATIALISNPPPSLDTHGGISLAIRSSQLTKAQHHNKDPVLL